MPRYIGTPLQQQCTLARAAVPGIKRVHHLQFPCLFKDSRPALLTNPRQLTTLTSIYLKTKQDPELEYEQNYPLTQRIVESEMISKQRDLGYDKLLK